MWHDNETTVDHLHFGAVADAWAKLRQQAKAALVVQDSANRPCADKKRAGLS